MAHMLATEQRWLVQRVTKCLHTIHAASIWIRHAVVGERIATAPTHSNHSSGTPPALHNRYRAEKQRKQRKERNHRSDYNVRAARGRQKMMWFRAGSVRGPVVLQKPPIPLATKNVQRRQKGELRVAVRLKQPSGTLTLRCQVCYQALSQTIIISRSTTGISFRALGAVY
uniref:Uncharacterized protein n=1 Tax=Anopheles albimanus TaxID=7167 RepID=A0A182FR69_ANOAL